MTLFIILLSPLALILVISLITRKWANPWKLYLVFGKKGSGKSTYLVKLAIRYMKKGFFVYSNMPDMMIPGVRLIDTDLLGDFVPVAHSLLLIDEVGMIWDNRNYKNFKSSVRDFFKLQRHYKVITYLASQTFDIDKKLRDLTDGMILNINVLNVLSVGKVIRRHVTLTEPTSEAESRIAEVLKFAPFWSWKFTVIPRYAKYFNSYVVPNVPQIHFTEVINNNPDKQIKKMLKEIDNRNKRANKRDLTRKERVKNQEG